MVVYKKLNFWEEYTPLVSMPHKGNGLYKLYDWTSHCMFINLQVAKRKLRRSNSCSDLRTNQKSMKVGMLGGRNAPALVEEQVEARGRGREEMRPVSSQRLVRAVSSTKLFVR